MNTLAGDFDNIFYSRGLIVWRNVKRRDDM